MSTNPIDTRLRALSVQSRKTDADRMVEKMHELHRRIAFDLDHDDEKAPVWCAHLPSGEVMPIRLIGAFGPFVRITGFGASEDACDYVLLAPEQVVVSIQTLPTDGAEPRRPIGFVDWPAEDSDAPEVA